MSVGRSVARARTRVRHPRHRADAVTGTPSRRWRYRGRGKRAFFFAGAFLAAGFLAAGFLALFLAGAGSSSGAEPLNGLILLKKLPMASMVAQSGFAGLRQRATLACVGAVMGAVLMAVSRRRRVCEAGRFGRTRRRAAALAAAPQQRGPAVPSRGLARRSARVFGRVVLMAAAQRLHRRFLCRLRVASLLSYA